MPRTVEVTTGSRLHFGMFSFGHPGTRQFGGVGAMIDQPEVRVRIRPAAQLQVEGPMRERALEVARRMEGELPCAIEILSSPRQHTGLGSGTQLALAVARSLCAYLDRPCSSAEELARIAGRGRRSAIGLHGFWQGGLILERGKLEAEDISPLTSRVELPGEWRWLVVCPREASGLSGVAEENAFERLPPVPEEVTVQLCGEATANLLPSAAGGDFEHFSRSLYRFGRMAGECFASFQAGAYATQQTADLVDAVRRQGIDGVGQSSWGPAVFALLRNEAEAQRMAEWLVESYQGYEITIARPMNCGAGVTISTDSESSPSSRPRASRGP